MNIKDKKKHGISTGKVRGKKRLIAGMFIFTAVMIIVLCWSTISIIRNRFKKFYIETCVEVVNSYTSGIEELEIRFVEELRRYSESDVAASGTVDEILEYLSQEANGVHEVIRNLWYVDRNGNAYAIDGKRNHVEDREYFNAMRYGNKDFYISNGIDSKVNGDKVFVITYRIPKDTKNEGGFFFYSVSFQKLENVIGHLSYNKRMSGFIITTNGEVFIAPKQYSVIRNNTNEMMEEDRNEILNFCREAKYKEAGITTLSTQNFPEEIVVYRHFTNTPWIVGITIPEILISSITSGLLKHMLSFFTLILLVIIFTYWLLIKKFFDPASSHRLTLHQQDDFDQLTGLWTEAHFEEAAEKLLAENPEKNYMLLGIDIRGFRAMQSTRGIGFANECLMALAKRLSVIALSENGIVSRGATDHFYLMCPIRTKEGAIRKYESYLYSGNYLPGNNGYQPLTKTGIVFAGADYLKDSVHNLIGKVSYAKRTIKNNLLKNYAIFEDSIEEGLLKEQRIESYIPKAFDRREFYVVYQPKMDIRTNRIVGAEALVRWNSREMGKQNPDSFISLFEKNGYITKLDFYVYREVFEFITRQNRAGNPVVPISVNVSRNHLETMDFVRDFEALFAGYNILPELIEIEIVERAADVEIQTICSVMQQLHDKGFKIAIDDFGAGESSLNMLPDIPVDVVKLDQKFMRHSKGLSVESKQIIEKILEMTNLLGKETVCEGVETLDQIEFLRSVNCNEVQGYYYSRPLEEEAFVQFVKEHI